MELTWTERAWGVSLTFGYGWLIYSFVSFFESILCLKLILQYETKSQIPDDL